MTTFTAVLARQVAAEPGRPLVTFYDHASGERTELSVATYANWVAKTASLLVDELDLERGQVLRVDLPTHWLGPVFLANVSGASTYTDDMHGVLKAGPKTPTSISGAVSSGGVRKVQLYSGPHDMEYDLTFSTPIVKAAR